MIELDELQRALDHASGYLSRLPEEHVGATGSLERLRSALGGPLPDEPSKPAEVIDHLVESVDGGLVAGSGPRFFGFVNGGALPVTVAADWLTTVWDQNAGLYVLSPAAAVVEEVAGSWIAGLLGLPAEVSCGFVTGAQTANTTGLAAARHHVLRRAGWDVEQDGLQGAPPVHILAGAERHSTIDRSLRLLGFGTSSLTVVDADGQGRMVPGALATALRDLSGPAIVCAQAGNVNTGAFDPFSDICESAHEHGAWVHVDGAFGLWAGASPDFRHLIEGSERADSWATDAHKWLNVPYDCGIVFCAHPDSHRAALGMGAASYLVRAEADQRDAVDWNPESSRRARGFTVYAALRSLGRAGLAELIERCCAHARRFADLLSREDSVEVLNDVVLNQVLVRFRDDDGDHDARTRTVIAAVQNDGTCWLGGSVWHGMQVMRISVVNHSTTDSDVDRSVEAILRAARRPSPPV